MEVRSVVITKPTRPGATLAEAVVTITNGHGADEIVISDYRVLSNRSGQLWVGPPTRAIRNGRDWRYEATIHIHGSLKKEVEAAILAEYEKWESQLDVRTVNGKCEEAEGGAL